jgi:hypothetical protein
MEPGLQGRRRGRWTGAKEEQMVSVKGDAVLVKDESFVKYDRLLTKAEAEGRIDGPCKCLTCGMRYLTKEEAESCCKSAP